MLLVSWACQFSDCSSTAVGVGSPVGLRAIGWFIRENSYDYVTRVSFTILCPHHRPDIQALKTEPLRIQELIREIDVELAKSREKKREKRLAKEALQRYRIQW